MLTIYKKRFSKSFVAAIEEGEQQLILSISTRKMCQRICISFAIIAILTEFVPLIFGSKPPTVVVILSLSVVVMAGSPLVLGFALYCKQDLSPARKKAAATVLHIISSLDKNLIDEVYGWQYKPESHDKYVERLDEIAIEVVQTLFKQAKGITKLCEKLQILEQPALENNFSVKPDTKSELIKHSIFKLIVFLLANRHYLHEEIMARRPEKRLNLAWLEPFFEGSSKIYFIADTLTIVTRVASIAIELKIKRFDEDTTESVVNEMKKLLVNYQQEQNINENDNKIATELIKIFNQTHQSYSLNRTAPAHADLDEESDLLSGTNDTIVIINGAPYQLDAIFEKTNLVPISDQSRVDNVHSDSLVDISSTIQPISLESSSGSNLLGLSEAVSEHYSSPDSLSSSVR